jgi:transcription initiation factor TFIIB
LQATAETCPYCGGAIIQESTENVCSRCGTVVEGVFDTGPERIFGPENTQRLRTGPPISLVLHDGGLATVIGSASTKTSSSDDWRETYNLQKWQRRVRVSDATERNLVIALSELRRLSAALTLPKNVLETASVIYRRAIKKRLIRGRSIHNVTAAAIYMACRQCGVPRTLDEIATVSMLNKKDIGRSYRIVARQLDVAVPIAGNESYASRLTNRLVISGKAKGITIRILDFARQMKLTSGRGPVGITAASMYIATVLTNERKTQREIAESAGVTEVTIRNRYKELLEKLVIQVPL